MTNNEFNACKLTRRLEFKLVEAARYVLVHEMDFKTAMTLTGLNNRGDEEKLIEAIKLFNVEL